MQVCFLQHTHAVLHSLKIGPLSIIRDTLLVFRYMRVCIMSMHSNSVTHLNLLTGFPMSSGHCSSPFAILSHFLNRS